MRRLWLAPAAIASVLAGLVVVPTTAVAANTFPTNPAGFAYKFTTGVAQYAQPAGMVITGRCNRYDPEFAAARAEGAEVLAYLNAPEAPQFAGVRPGQRVSIWAIPAGCRCGRSLRE